MKQNRQDCTEDEARLFVRPYDDDCDEALSYTEFLYCFLSSSLVYRDKVIKRLCDKDLRLRKQRGKKQVVMSPNPKAVHPREGLPYDVEYGIRRIIEQEIELQK
jgi:hypothetical protein